jgi:hypothetical protein
LGFERLLIFTPARRMNGKRCTMFAYHATIKDFLPAIDSKAVEKWLNPSQ